MWYLIVGLLSALIAMVFTFIMVKKNIKLLIRSTFEGMYEDIERDIRIEKTKLRGEVANIINKEMNQCIGEIVNFDRFTHRSYYGSKPIPQYVKDAQKFISEEIRRGFRRELQNLNDRHDRVNRLEDKLINDLEQKVDSYINTEEFIDIVVNRIKRKQLNG